MPLKYLFTATFADNTIIQQTPEDKSQIDPEKRSQYYDVVQYETKSPLVSFVLKGEGHTYGVDLRDGHFEVDGVPFRMHEDPEYIGFRVIFFRQHSHHIQVSQEANKEVGHDIVYRLGWQCTHGSRNYQQVMQID